MLSSVGGEWGFIFIQKYIHIFHSCVFIKTYNAKPNFLDGSAIMSITSTAVAADAICIFEYMLHS